MILVTGATGQLGRATIDFLLKKVPANEISALVRNENKALDLKEKGIDIRVGNYHDYESLVKAFAGVEKLLLVSSSDFNDRLQQQLNAVNAAKEAGVKYIAYTSFGLKSLENSAIQFVIDDHFKTAEKIKKSGLKYTLLDNTLYSDVLPMFLGHNVLETGVFLPAGDGKAPFATRLDMAEATANVLIDSVSHENKEYLISSNRLYSISDVATYLSELSGKTINYIDADEKVFVETLTKVGVPQEYVGLTASFATAIKNKEFELYDNTLATLLGREETSLKDYLKSAFFS
ncbi:MAG: SDR family oxidoreductase [Candidatus Sericytochromatia bacterium]